MDTILKVENLSKIYESGKGIKNINLELKKGVILGIVGLNGAGKTTLLSCLAGFLKSTSGNVEYYFDGKVERYETALRNLGIVMAEQGYPDYFNSKQINNIMKNTYKSWDSNKFDYILDEFDISNETRIKDYSTGAKSKLSLAIALSHKSKILILDEVTNGLDIVARKKVRDLLYKYVESGESSIIITSHIMSDIEKISDEIIFINDGAIQLNANKDDLLYNYRVFEVTTEQLSTIDKKDIIKIKKSDYSNFVLVKNFQEFHDKYGFDISETSLEEVADIILN